MVNFKRFSRFARALHRRCGMEELPKEVQLLVDSMTSNMIQLKDLTPAIWLNLVIQAIKRAEALDVQSVLELGDHRLAG